MQGSLSSTSPSSSDSAVHGQGARLLPLESVIRPRIGGIEVSSRRYSGGGGRRRRRRQRQESGNEPWTGGEHGRDRRRGRGGCGRGDDPAKSHSKLDILQGGSVPHRLPLVDNKEGNSDARSGQTADTVSASETYKPRLIVTSLGNGKQRTSPMSRITVATAAAVNAQFDSNCHDEVLRHAVLRTTGKALEGS